MGRLAQKARRGWWKRGPSVRPVTAASEGMPGWPLGRRLTVALLLDVVGELHRQRSNCVLEPVQGPPIVDRLTAPTRTGNRAASALEHG